MIQESRWRLTELVLEDVCLGDDGVQRLLRCGPLLERLALVKMPAVVDADLAGLADHCPRLNDVSVKGCVGLTDVAVAHITACSRLKALCLSNCPLITSAGFQDVLSHSHGLRTLLVTLHVLNKKRNITQVVVTPTGLSDLWAAAPQLQYFTLSQHRLTYGAFAAVGPALQVLCLSDCAGVDDAVLGTISRRCRSLWRFTLRVATLRGLEITSTGLGLLADLPALEDVDITFDDHMWPGLVALVRRCQSLRLLYIGAACLDVEQVDLLRSFNPTLTLDCGPGL